jgi:hypothetical protein
LRGFFVVQVSREDKQMRATLILLLATAVSGVGCSAEAESAGMAEAGQPRSLLELERQEAVPPLQSDRLRHDFGEIPIDGGVVETVFQVENDGEETQLVAVYTSCGCTSAVLEFGDGSTAGPFGMPGHGDPLEIDRTLAPGESFQVKLAFDPAAHGPQGLGNVMRVVSLHTRGGATAELTITANVVRL